MTTTQQSPPSPIGRDTLRIDGPRKVTGLAQYTSDFSFPAMLYAGISVSLQCCTRCRWKPRSRMANC